MDMTVRTVAVHSETFCENIHRNSVLVIIKKVPQPRLNFCSIRKELLNLFMGSSAMTFENSFLVTIKSASIVSNRK